MSPYRLMSSHDREVLPPSGFGNFFLVRPVGIYPRTGKPWVPTVVQRGDKYFGEHSLFSANDEIEPIAWTRGYDPSDVRQGWTTDIRETNLEWCPLPDAEAYA